MTDKELSKLNRRELLEILLEISRENDALKEEIERLKNELSQKELLLSQSGSLSEIIDKIHDTFNQVQSGVRVNDYPIPESKKEVIVQKSFIENKEEVNMQEEAQYSYVEKMSGSSWDSILNRFESYVNNNKVLKETIDFDMFDYGDE